MAYGIAQHIQQVSQDALKIGEGSLYPALQRLLLNDFVVAEWGLSENTARPASTKITAAGRKQLAQEKRSFDALLSRNCPRDGDVMKLWKRIRYLLNRERFDPRSLQKRCASSRNAEARLVQTGTSQERGTLRRDEGFRQ